MRILKAIKFCKSLMTYKERKRKRRIVGEKFSSLSPEYRKRVTNLLKIKVDKKKIL